MWDQLAKWPWAVIIATPGAVWVALINLRATKASNKQVEATSTAASTLEKTTKLLQQQFKMIHSQYELQDKRLEQALNLLGQTPNS